MKSLQTREKQQTTLELRAIKRLMMKKINTNRQTFLQLGIALALILVFLRAAAAASHAPETGARFNATRITEWLPDDEEFLMESETNRRILQDGNGGKTLIALNPGKPFCDPNKYGSCIKMSDRKGKPLPIRICGYQDCGRPGM